MENKITTAIIPKGTDLLNSVKTPSSGYPTTPAVPIYKSSSNISSTLTPPLKSTLTSTLSSPLSLSTLSSASTASQSKPHILKYIMLIIFLIFLILTLVLYLIKPDSTKIGDIYAPLITFFSKKKDAPQAEVKLENIINDKIKLDNVDKSEQCSTDKAVNDAGKDGEEVINLIPVSNDTNDPIQSQSKTKSGSCYIGTDKGFRNCVNIGEGDKCMSGDIFPTLEMCINPKLRE